VSTVSTLRSWVDAARRIDTRWQRHRAPDLRHVVFDARTAMEYAMMAPVHRRLIADPRVRVSLMSSDRPEQVAAIYRDAPDASFLSPRRALLSKVDVYVAADFLWATLARGTCRIQMFHGVAGKWAHIYDRPATSMRLWDRLFFINQRRLRNYVTAGAIEAESPAIRLIGMPKLDCLVDGSYDRNNVLAQNGLDPARPTVLYAPTWTPYSSLNVMGEKVVQLLLDAGLTVLVKLHENSRDLRPANSGGIDWHARLEPILRQRGGLLIEGSDACPWMVAADVLISDHSSVAFEYLLLDRPMIRIHLPELIARGAVAPEYVELMIEASTTAANPEGVCAAVDHALATPDEGSASRRAVAADLFHQPGTATDRAVREIYAAIELEPVRVPDRHTVVSRGSVAATEVR
jgi:hypothetical protein